MRTNIVIDNGLMQRGQQKGVRPLSVVLYEDDDDLRPCPSSRAGRWPQSAGRDVSPFRKGCYADPHKHCWAAP